MISALSPKYSGEKDIASRFIEQRDFFGLLSEKGRKPASRVGRNGESAASLHRELLRNRYSQKGSLGRPCANGP